MVALDPVVLELAVEEGDVGGALAQPGERVEEASEVDPQLHLRVLGRVALHRRSDKPPREGRDVADRQRGWFATRRAGRRNRLLDTRRQRACLGTKRFAGRRQPHAPSVPFHQARPDPLLELTD